MANYFESVEMFGQYGGNGGSEPDPARHVKISSFGEILTPFESIRRPVKVPISIDFKDGWSEKLIRFGGVYKWRHSLRERG